MSFNLLPGCPSFEPIPQILMRPTLGHHAHRDPDSGQGVSKLARPGQARTVRIRASRPVVYAVDRLAPADRLDIRQGAVEVLMLAGSVRVVEVR